MGRSRDQWLVVSSVGVSALGDFMLWIPLTLHLQTTGSGFVVAGMLIGLWAPIVVLAPLSGWVVDHFESRAVLLVASLGQAIVGAALIFALDSTAAILVLVTLLGVGFAFAQPAEFSLVPVIGAGRDLTRLNGLVESSRYLGMTAGPALGGVVAGLGGTRVAVLINAATFVFVALAAVFLHARRRPQPAAEGEPKARIRDGVICLFRERTLGLVMTVVFVSLLFMSASIAAEVFFVREDLGASPVVYGLIFSSWTVGMVAGALVVARLVRAGSLALGVLVAVLVQSIGLGLPTVWLVIPFGAALWFVGGVGHGTKNVLARTLIQRDVPERLHGRAFAAYNGLRNGAELIALAIGGALVTWFGARFTLALAGAVPAAAALVGIAVYRRPAASRSPAAVPADIS